VLDSVSIGDGTRSITYEASMLSKGLDVKILDDFYRLDNGNLGVYIELPVKGEYELDNLILIIEYPQNYPESSPRCFIENLEDGSPHVFSNKEICYMNKKHWKDNYSSYEAGYLIRTWIYGYSSWVHTKNWKMPEANALDYIVKFFEH